jgi:hypothetical protein
MLELQESRIRQTCCRSAQGVAALAVTAAAALQAQPAAAPTLQAFDGRWSVAFTCDPVMARGKLVKGEALSFFVDVQGGRLEGRLGNPGAAGSVQYVGTIAADGSADIMASGHTGSADGAAGAADPAGAYNYTMRGSFGATSGSALRSEFRPCRARFDKQ